MLQVNERPKVAIIGCGQVGTQAAAFLAIDSVCNLIFYDVVEGLAKGRALDLSQAAGPSVFDISITAVDSLEETCEADIFLITAGKTRLPGMSRTDLINTNTEILESIAKKLSPSKEDSVFVVVTNPLDVMVSLFLKKSGRGRTKVLGMGGILDSARLAYFIFNETGVSPLDIDAWVLGAHSDTMVPCFSLTRIKGEPASEFLTSEQKERIVERTRRGGAEVVSYLKTGSAFLAPGASAARLIKAIVEDENIMLPVSIYLDGEYGFKGAALGVPAIVGRNGIERIVEIQLDPDELEALKASFEEVKEALSRVS